MIAFAAPAKAQDSLVSVPMKTYKVGIFTPLFLDSAFSGNKYRYTRSYPSFAKEGFEFAQGALIALDSMTVMNANIEASIIDVKSTSMPLATLISSSVLDSLNLIIGAVKDNEYQMLAAFAKNKKIPFISATYPNDGGVKNNPYLAIANPTLKAHCEAIFSYLLQTSSGSNIIMAKRNTSRAEVVEGIFNKLNSPDGSPLLPIKTITFDDDFSALKTALDSTRSNIIIGASLNEAFITKLSAAASILTDSFAISLMGMPNWDGFKITRSNNENSKNLAIYYTTPFYNSAYNSFNRKIEEKFRSRVKYGATDVALKAYELVFQNARLLPWYPANFMENLNQYPYRIFSDFNYKPVYLNGSSEPDYYENKRLYLMKVMNGTANKVW